MCGRFAVTTDPALLAEKIRAIDEASAARGGQAGSSKDGSPAASSADDYSFAANYNVAPTTTVSAVVRRHAEPDDVATRRIRSMRWGLVPPWVKATADGTPDTRGPLLINARAETVTTSGAFRAAAKNRRCLVPMDGWYEWTPGAPATAGGKPVKTPHYMSATDGEPLFMAGLWAVWRPRESGEPAGELAGPLLSCTIITTEAAGPLAAVHDRMPLSVSARDWDRWLDPDAPIDEGVLRGHGELDRIGVREVSRLVNSVRNNGPELLEPVGRE